MVMITWFIGVGEVSTLLFPGLSLRCASECGCPLTCCLCCFSCLTMFAAVVCSVDRLCVEFGIPGGHRGWHRVEAAEPPGELDVLYHCAPCGPSNSKNHLRIRTTYRSGKRKRRRQDTVLTNSIKPRRCAGARGRARGRARVANARKGGTRGRRAPAPMGARGSGLAKREESRDKPEVSDSELEKLGTDSTSRPPGLRIGTWNLRLSKNREALMEVLACVDICVLTETASRLKGLAEFLEPDFTGVNFPHMWKGKPTYKTGGVALVYRKELAHAMLGVQRMGASIVQAQFDGSQVGLRVKVLNVTGAYMVNASSEYLNAEKDWADLHRAAGKYVGTLGHGSVVLEDLNARIGTAHAPAAVRWGGRLPCHRGVHARRARHN